jgi:hypothetical protein
LHGSKAVCIRTGEKPAGSDQRSKKGCDGLESMTEVQTGSSILRRAKYSHVGVSSDLER